MKSFRLDKIINVEEGYSSEVRLDSSLSTPIINEKKLTSYIPTSRAISALESIGKSLAPNWPRRSRFITGQYGTGKSHLGLVVANIFQQSADADGMKQLVEKLERKDPKAAEAFQKARWKGNIQEPFLIVVPDSQRSNFNLALLAALEKALEQAGIDDQLHTYFDEAIRKLDEMLEKPALEKQLVAELQKREKNLDILRSNLSKYQQEDFDDFVDVVRTITMIEFVPRSQAKAGPVFKEATRLLRSEHGYAGIMVIADEFGKHLRTLANDQRSSEAMAVQDFAEVCNESRDNQLHFIAIAHQTLADYASLASNNQDWQKVAGRFEDHSFNYEHGQEEEIVDLISAVILRKEKTKKQQEYWQSLTPLFGLLSDWVKNSELYSAQDDGWRREQLLTGCYPLHPATVFCLPWMSQRLGQVERTSFRFLASDEEGSLLHYIRETDAFFAENAFNTYTPERLLDFFGTAARENSRFAPEMVAYDDAFAICGTEEMAHRILKLIAVLAIVGDPRLQATESTLVSILGRSAQERDDLPKVLEALTKMGCIRLNQQRGTYELPRRSEGDLSPREAVDQIKAKWSTDSFKPIAEIKQLRKQETIVATGYKEKKELPRRAAVVYVTPDHLSNLAEPEETIKAWYEPGVIRYQGDALIWYIFALEDKEIKQAEKALNKGTGSEQHIVALPKLPFMQEEALRDLAAINQLRRAGRKVGDSVVDANDLQLFEEQTITDVESAINDYFQASNFNWHSGAGIDAKVKDGGEDNLLSRLFLDLFPDTPAINDAAVTVGTISSQNKSARHKAVADLIEMAEDPLRIEKAGGSAKVRILREVLLKTELFEKVRDLGSMIEIEVRKKVPAKSVLGKVWHLIDKELAKEDDDIHFGPLIRQLLSPPYGLSPALVEVLLGAYFRYILGNFQIIDEQVNVYPPSDTLVIDIVKEPEKYALIYYKFTPEQKRLLKGILELMAVGELPNTGEVDKARDALLEWYGNLPTGARQSRDYEDKVITLFELLEDETRNIDSKALLLEDMPKALGISRKDLTAQDAKTMLTVLEEIKSIADSYAQRRAQEAIEALSDKFGIKGKNMEALVSGMLTWWDSLLTSQRIDPYDSSTQSLVKCLSKGRLNENDILVDLPHDMNLPPYTEWTDNKDIQLFVSKVQHAKEIIEAHRGTEPGEAGNGGDAPETATPAEIKKQILDLLDRNEITYPERIKLLKALLKDLQK